MGGFGALDFMNKTLKNNRGLVKKINVFERVKPYNSVLKGKRVKFDAETTPEKLQEIRAETRAANRRATWIQVAKMTLVLVVIIVVLTILIGGVIEGKT